MGDIKEFVEHCVNIWNEADADRCRQTIRALWQEDARHLARSLEAVGLDGIETRVRNAYEKWVREKGNVFRLWTVSTAITTSSSCAGRWCRPAAAT